MNKFIEKQLESVTDDRETLKTVIILETGITLVAIGFTIYAAWYWATVFFALQWPLLTVLPILKLKQLKKEED